MSCPNTPELIADHCDPHVSAEVLKRHQLHLDACRFCQLELIVMRKVSAELLRWQPLSVPDWDRTGMIRASGARKSLPSRPLKWSVIQRWLPLAASLVLGVAVIAQSSLTVGPQGWSLSFGSQSQGLTAAQLDEVLTAFAASQQLQTRHWVESALQTHAESTADSVYQWMTYMEQQRASDVQRMESGFEQLLNRDFQTVDSVRQLASYVMYQVTP
jgi:hypothetical protein